jgi:predicted amidohydrolase YtcJ
MGVSDGSCRNASPRTTRSEHVIADLLIVNATLWGRRSSSALAVNSGRVVAIGSDDDLRDFAGSKTRVIDARRRSVLPSFQDAHIHPLQGGLALTRFNLHGVTGPVAVRAAIESYALAHPTEPWIIGFGWEEDIAERWIDKAFLDAVVPDRPVFLMSAGLHDAWVNSAALRAATIDGNHPDPSYGRIGKYDDGQPNGLLHEGAVRLIEEVAPRAGDSVDDLAMLGAQAHLHRLGITAWQDAWTTPDVLEVYQRLASRGLLTARVTTALWWDRLAGEEQIESFIANREGARNSGINASTIKIMVDGTTGNFTASMLEPYLTADGVPTCNCGMSFVAPEKLASAVVRLDAAGFQVHFHAIGEGAVRSALDAVEAARRANGWSDLRHHISHVCLVHPADIARFAALDVAANIQPYWATNSVDMVRESRFLGEVRSTWWYPFESIRAGGARLAGGSDWPVSTADPFDEIHVAVNRALPGTTDDSFLPHERLSLVAAVEAFTSGAAYANHLDDRSGNITVGKLADLTVIDRDILACDPSEIADASVILTLLGGDAVYEDDTLDDRG